MNTAEETRPASFRVTGMHCPACELLVADEVGSDPAVQSARARRSDERLWVELHADEAPEALKERWNRRLDPLGYRVWLDHENPSKAQRHETWAGLAWGGLFLAAFASLQASGWIDLFSPDALNLPGALLLGLLASVSSCFALVGGLLVTYTASVGRRHPEAVLAGLSSFHLSRLVVFFLGGGVLGLAGSALGPSMELQRLLITGAALVMAALGLSLLGVKVPGFGTGMKAVQTARSLAAGGRSRWATLLTGAGLGALTFLLPCGFTQSVQFQALASGTFAEGALLTLVFALGTLPVLLSVSWFLGRGLTGRRRAVLLKAGGTLVLGLGLYQLAAALNLWGVNLS